MITEITNQQIKKALEGAIYWNTGAFYTEQGQRLGAIEIEGRVLMVDIDRGLNYEYDCEFYEDAITHAYLNNRDVWRVPADPGFHFAVRRALEDATREHAPIVK